ncbi:LysR family transcriptional regulator [Sandaracinus amylolyticus]|uniref:Transcriptional regulator, LysR family protein n=1 Tax=Sandaracinus amylolyticus TaxID=927083 RepID=A0A0F6YGB6_9BACT|nr:LysR family transcriptional regulator [Sandaracinus amylolyticus]AKF04501.1 Transcriptional regulator, LysR family protein [Sandaracinus amylolyticus]
MSAAHGSIRRLDLNLLLTFEAIDGERNLTRAASRLFVSQSAVSHALARLRAQLGDELFVRHGRGVVPTEAAERLAPAVREALAILRHALEPHDFDPARDVARVALAVHDELEPAVLPALAARVRAHAPDATIECVRLDRASIEQELGSGRLDLVVDVARAAGPELRHALLARDSFCVVSRRRRVLDAKKYLAARHVTVSSRRSGSSMEDLLLDRLGHERVVVARCQRYEAACRIVAGSDLLLTAPRLHAQSIARRLELALLPVPLPLPPIELHVYWHRHADTDARNRWLRARLLEGIERPTSARRR